MTYMDMKTRTDSVLDKLLGKLRMDLYDMTEELLGARGYDFYVRTENPNPKTGRWYDTNAPESERKEIHNQAVEKVRVHYNSMPYPGDIKDEIGQLLDQAKEG